MGPKTFPFPLKRASIAAFGLCDRAAGPVRGDAVAVGRRCPGQITPNAKWRNGAQRLRLSNSSYWILALITAYTPHAVACGGTGPSATRGVPKSQASPSTKSKHSASALKIQPAPPGMPFGVHIDVITSMANLEGFVLPPRYPRPPGAPPW
jgi:hypothetical protein